MPSLVEPGPPVLGEKVWQCIFAILFFFPWKRDWIIWTNLNPLHPRMLCAKFGCSWHCGSGEDFQFSLFRYLSPWERECTFILNKLQSPSLKDALCQVYLKSAQWFWRWSWKPVKFTTTTTTTTTTTDNGPILIRKGELQNRELNPLYFRGENTQVHPKDLSFKSM